MRERLCFDNDGVLRYLSYPSSITDYFISKGEILEKGLMDKLERDYLSKHDAVNHTARALTERGLAFVAAPLLHD